MGWHVNCYLVYNTNSNEPIHPSSARSSVSTNSGREGDASRLNHQPDEKGKWTMGPFFAETGPDDGILLYRDIDGPIEVFEDPDRTTPIGTARCVGWDAAGSAVWKLVIHDEEMDGPCLVVDREFLSTSPDWQDLYRRDRARPAGPAAAPR
jgi:hypothetical protein